MVRKVAYWASTGVIAALMCFAAFSYLSGGPQVVEGFARVGYPQQLRIILGIVKPLGAIALIIPGYSAEGMGVRGIHLCVDLRGVCALSGRTEIRSNVASRIAGAALCFLCDASGK